MKFNPSENCDLCPRLKSFIDGNRVQYPHYFNAPVPTFQSDTVKLLIVGLAPGLKGANQTGRPFTGDYAGDLLYETLLEFGFAKGVYQKHKNDGLTLIDTAITNAVRCVPPENKPTPLEINTCRQFLIPTISHYKDLKAILVLGKIAHDSVVKALNGKLSAYPFKHGAKHSFNAISLFDSYHCSRYNTNTGVLTPEMFKNVFREIQDYVYSGSVKFMDKPDF